MGEEQISRVNKDDERRLLIIEWNSPSTDVTKSRQYPYAWLRDCCPCTACMHPTTLSRLVLMRNLDPHILPQQVELSSPTSVSVVWKDGHKSDYSTKWLVARNFDPEVQKLRQPFYVRPLKFWGSELQDKVIRLDFNKIMTDDKTLHEWLVTLEETGIALITGAPAEAGQLDKLGDRVSFLRSTHYGTVFNVMNQEKPNNLARTNATLGLHTDLAYFNYVPGVQLLHCIQQTSSEGGENEFSDGFSVAEQLRNEKPDVFKILSTVPVDFYDVGVAQSKKYYQYHRTPIFSLNRNEEVVKITYNNQVRDFTVNLPVDQVTSLYEALRTFDDSLYSPRNVIRLKLSEGDVITFANMRVLHGRLGFQAGTHRLLQGTYIDWEEIRSRRRVLDLDLYSNDFPFIYAKT